MTVVLVHGNPETAAVWDPLVAALGAAGITDVVPLSPPGFGAPVPDGFEATVDGYRDWLIGALERFDGPVDVVGHDWGGGHVATALMAQPELVRSCGETTSWASSSPTTSGTTSRRPGRRRASARRTSRPCSAGPRPRRRAAWPASGSPRRWAEGMAAGQDEAMQACVLRLYRDAAQPAMARRGEALGRLAARPGLAILATEDHFVGDEALRRRAAARAGAQVAVLRGLGHWWMVQDPDRGAGVLTAFWAGLSG